MARPHIQLAGGQWHLWRLADDEFVSLGHHALPLLQNYDLMLRLSQRQSPSGATLWLAHVLAVLELRFGPSSRLFDHHHGSFSFPLLLTIERGRRISILLRCHDYRGMLYFPLYRVTSGDPSAEERARYHTPVADDFSQTEMDEFVTSFHGYLLQQGHLLESGLAVSYYRAIQSDSILYGYDGTAFFQRSYASWEAYDQACQELETRLGPKRARSTSDRVERIIDRITEP